MNQIIRKLIEEKRNIFHGLPVAFDGVVDEKTYTASSIRTVFLLKEVNGEETEFIDGKKIVKQMSEDWNYTDWLYKQAQKGSAFYKTWPNVCLLIEILRNEETSYMDCMNEYGAFDSDRLRKNLAEIAIVNIKKTPGSGSSNYEEITNAAENPENAKLRRGDKREEERELCQSGRED